LPEAEAELAGLSPAARGHETVLQFEWELLARGNRWPEALATAERMISSHPLNPAGFIHYSFVLHELKRTEEARDNLLKQLGAFPENPTFRYNLACYEAQLGNLPAARKWLSTALALPGSEELHQAARTDPDLAPLRGEKASGA